jgi:hypothetical protein
MLPNKKGDALERFTVAGVLCFNLKEHSELVNKMKAYWLEIQNPEAYFKSTFFILMMMMTMTI